MTARDLPCVQLAGVEKLSGVASEGSGWVHLAGSELAGGSGRLRCVVLALLLS